MATATSHEQYQNRHLPPSPPPSPPSTRRRHKKRTDSFEKLANTPLPSRASSPAEDPHATSNQDSLIARIVLTPVLFISFILSLSFVNLRDRAHRTYSHSSTSFLSYIYPSRWLDLEPYQDPNDSRWSRGDSAGHVAPCDTISPKSEDKNKRRSWHLNKKIRKMAKLEVSDAFEMRGRVMVGMLAMLLVGSVVLLVGVRWLFLALWRSLGVQRAVWRW